MTPPRFQFSLAALLLNVAFVAGVLALMFKVDPKTANLLFILSIIASSAFLATGLVYCRGNSRAFCIGAAFPLMVAFGYITHNLDLLIDQVWPFIPVVEDDREWGLKVNQRLFGFAYLLSVALGYLCVGLRWLIERGEPPDRH